MNRRVFALVGLVAWFTGVAVLADDKFAVGNVWTGTQKDDGTRFRPKKGNAGVTLTIKTRDKDQFTGELQLEDIRFPLPVSGKAPVEGDGAVEFSAATGKKSGDQQTYAGKLEGDQMILKVSGRMGPGMVNGTAILNRKGAADLDAKRPTTDAKLFCAYAIEFLVADLEALPSRPLVQLRPRLLYQQLLLDLVRRHANTINDAALTTLIQQYETRLSQALTVSKEFSEAVAKTNRDLEQKISQAQANVAMNGLLYGLAVAGNGGSDVEAFFSGLGAAAGTQAKEEPKLTAERQKAFDVVKKLDATLRAGLQKEAEGAKTEFRKTTAGDKWKDAAFAYRGTADPLANPLAIITESAPAKPGVRDLVNRAERLQKAALAVPAVEAFDQFRVILFGMAGRLANQAAVADLGLTGLPTEQAKAATGGKLAKAAWMSYLQFEKLEARINDQVVREAALACAFAGTPMDGFLLLQKRVGDQRGLASRSAIIDPVPTFSKDPFFWYDAARVSGASGAPVFAFKCLQIAVQNGFIDRELAANCLDLQSLQKDANAKAQFNALFKR